MVTFSQWLRGNSERYLLESAQAEMARLTEGLDLPPIYNVIIDEELSRAGAPARPIVSNLAHGLLGHGSDDLKRRDIPGQIADHAPTPRDDRPPPLMPRLRQPRVEHVRRGKRLGALARRKNE